MCAQATPTLSRDDRGQSLQETGDPSTLPLLEIHVQPPSIYTSADAAPRSDSHPNSQSIHVLEEDSQADNGGESDFAGHADDVTKHRLAKRILFLSLTAISILAIVYYLHSTDRLHLSSSLPNTLISHIPLSLTTIQIPSILEPSRREYTPLSSPSKRTKRRSKGSRDLGRVHESRLVSWAIDSDPDGLGYEGDRESPVELNDAQQFGHTDEMVNASSPSARSSKSALGGRWFSAPSSKTMRAYFGKPGKKSRRAALYPSSNSGDDDSEEVVLWDLDAEAGRGEGTPLVPGSARRDYGAASF